MRRWSWSIVGLVGAEFSGSQGALVGITTPFAPLHRSRISFSIRWKVGLLASFGINEGWEVGWFSFGTEAGYWNDP